jgi:hypothetical protein
VNTGEGSERPKREALSGAYTQINFLFPILLLQTTTPFWAPVARRGSPRQDLPSAIAKSSRKRHTLYVRTCVASICTYPQQNPFTARFRDQKKPGVGAMTAISAQGFRQSLSAQAPGAPRCCGGTSAGRGHPIRLSVTRVFHGLQELDGFFSFSTVLQA